MLLPIGVLAAPPAAEPYEFQELEAQRNNALNDAVNLRSAWRRDTDYWRKYLEGEEIQRRAFDEWFKKYVDGVEAQHKQAAKRW